MSLLDVIKRRLLQTGVDTVKKAISNKAETFTFQKIPETVEELKKIPEADLQSPFRTSAVTVLALLRYREDPEACIKMLEYLNGPDEFTPMRRQFLNDVLKDRDYKPFSFFEGATPQNRYTPKMPLRIKVSQNPYSYPDETHAIMYLHSGGADNARPIELRKKPSTGEWFVTSMNFLGDIRIPTEEDPWA